MKSILFYTTMFLIAATLAGLFAFASYKIINHGKSQPVKTVEVHHIYLVEQTFQPETDSPETLLEFMEANQ